MSQSGNGHEESLTRLFCSLQDQLVGTAYYLVRNAEDARDVVQETFMKCWRCRDDVDWQRNPRAWVFQVAVNTAKDHLKSAWKRRTQPLDHTLWETSAKTLGPTDSASASEEMMQVRQAIMNLGPEVKEVFLLRQNGEMTYEQIAASLGLPLGTVKTRMRRSLQALRKAVTKTKITVSP